MYGMNRSATSDSKLSLDVEPHRRDPDGMSTHQFHVHLIRVDNSRRMARFYRLSLEPTLFGDFAVARNWGRIGTRGRSRLDLFSSQEGALKHFLHMMRQKKGRGYRPG